MGQRLERITVTPQEIELKVYAKADGLALAAPVQVTRANRRYNVTHLASGKRVLGFAHKWQADLAWRRLRELAEQHGVSWELEEDELRAGYWELVAGWVDMIQDGVREFCGGES